MSTMLIVNYNSFIQNMFFNIIQCYSLHMYYMYIYFSQIQ